MNEHTKAALVVGALSQRGFKYQGLSDAGWLKLLGSLHTSKGVHSCELKLDPNFFELPVIRLLEAPAGLPRVVPHLAGGVHLCYAARGSIVLDIFDPVGQTLACVQRAEQVLDQVLQGKLVEDLEEEFHFHWGEAWCVVDIQDRRLGKQDALWFEDGGRKYAVVTDDRERTVKKLRCLNWKVVDGTTLVYRIRTRAKPRPHVTNWPPKTVKDILRWQGLLDKRACKKIEEQLLKAFDSKVRGAVVLLESPLLTYAFGVFFDRVSQLLRSARPKQAVLRSQEVLPLTALRIDDRYIAERNIPGKKTLAAKRIALVGCGTIGGYLADMLVKAGAGTSGGQLTLVDSQALEPQNLGRHRLGFTNLLGNKAQELAREFERSAPGATVRALPVDVKLAQLGKLDLLIDATGEEALGHWLSSTYVATTQMLSVWIDGPGTAVRALLRNSSNGACFRCLCDANRRGELMPVKGGVPMQLAGQGCEGLYVPFPASVSVQAASLAASMVSDWANDVTSPALRTRVLEPGFELATPDCDPPRGEDCPACPS